MTEQLQKRLSRTQTLYVDLLERLDAGLLASRLGELPSNSIGGQLWCVVGARHSYAKAARAGSWQGFSCPLPGDQVTDPAAVLAALNSTFEEVLEAVSGDVYPEQMSSSGTCWSMKCNTTAN
jgi:predicted alpha/beta hydrolase